MAYKDIEVQRARDRERFRKRAAERIAAGLCPLCGDRPPAPERRACDPCVSGGPKVRLNGALWDDRSQVW